MYTRIVLLCVASGTAALVSSGCGSRAEERPTVVAAFYPLAFAARQVAPEGVRVVDLTPPGAEPHGLELGARDVARVRDASLVVYVGGGFQPALEDALEARDGPTLDVLESAVERSAADRRGADPHVWLDPVRYAAVARAIAAQLGDDEAADPLVARLEALDADLRRGLAHCARRELVTSHAAFGHLADRYRLEQVPLLGVAPEADPTPREVERLVRRVRASGVTTVFFEPLVSPDLAETVADEAGAATAVLDPVENLSAERLQAGVDYFDVMRENLDALRAGLSCR